jgi:AcrR family transcriptional regulator/DNA-binding MarR family transcriptional regulator
VEEIQRSRILQAMAYEVAERGPASVTVARVIARAGVSRRAFYELFSDIENCFLATLEWALDLARARVTPAYQGERSWRDACRAGLAALLRFFDENPPLAQLCVVHAPAGGPRVLTRRTQVLAEIAQVIDRGRQSRANRREPSSLVAEGVVGAVLAVLYTRLLARNLNSASDPRSAEVDPRSAAVDPRSAAVDSRSAKADPRSAEADSRSAKADPRSDEPAPNSAEPSLIELHGQLMSLMVLPYLGANASARELERTAPAEPIDAQPPEAPTSVRAMLELPRGRLTYRTVLVLRAIAQYPGGSNRDIAERAEIVDQGQISKILARLAEQDLLVNRGGSPHARGTPNAWWLTERGQSLERALRDTRSGPLRPRLSARRPSG